MSEIADKITEFYRQLRDDRNHRYKSWEHCYEYFTGGEVEPKIACLHLAFYLASWGMYRGSSFLLWKDYLVHEQVVEKLLDPENRRFLALEAPDIAAGVIELIAEIKDIYRKCGPINGEGRKVEASDTLVSKILLGTLGCTPAFDRYFIDGMREKNLAYSGIKEDNFKQVVEFYNKNRTAFIEAQATISEEGKSTVTYPPMKLVDMYFWQIGYELDKRKKKASS
jgi:hypothetical protein